MPTATDAELLHATPTDPAAFDALVLRHHDTIHRYVARRLGPTDADDIVNEVFMTAYTARGRFDPDQPSARPWLFGIATNLIRRHRRREAKALRAFAASRVDPVAPDIPGPQLGMSAEVAGALAALRPRERDVLFLHAVADLSLEEIAAALDAPLGTVKSWLHRARVRAAGELEARGVGRPNAPGAPPEGSEP